MLNTNRTVNIRQCDCMGGITSIFCVLYHAHGIHACSNRKASSSISKFQRHCVEKNGNFNNIIVFFLPFSSFFFYFLLIFIYYVLNIRFCVRISNEKKNKKITDICRGEGRISFSQSNSLFSESNKATKKYIYLTGNLKTNNDPLSIFYRESVTV